MATTGKDGFGLPPEIRSMAESSMTQARQAFDGFIGATQDAVARMEERAAAAHTGARAANERVMSFAQQNISNAFDYAERLVRAQNINEVMQIHADFAKTQMQAFSDQSKALSQAASQAVGKAAKKSG